MSTPERFSDKMFDQQHPRVADGTFTSKPQSAPEAALVPAPTVEASYIEAWNDAQGRPALDSNVAALVADELNETRNFSDANIAANIDGAHIAVHGFTQEAQLRYLNAVAMLRRSGFTDHADGVEAYVGALTEKHAAPAMTDAQAIAATDGIVPTSDARVQAGEILDTVVAPDGTIFYRRRAGVYPDMPDEMRIQTNRQLTDDEQDRLVGLVAYAYRAEIRGEQMSLPEYDSKFSFIVGSDLTKSSSDDTGLALERFEATLANHVALGSPMRTTDRAGAGTAGTRALEGFGPGLTFELYYDSVTVD
jgi:hypothetical protein